MMTPQQWLEALAKLIERIANKNYQEQVWLGKRLDRVSSWDEVIIQFFDDLDGDGFINGPWREAGLAEDQYNKLVKFRNALDENSQLWGDYPNPKMVLASSEWENVRKSARDFLKSINYI